MALVRKFPFIRQKYMENKTNDRVNKRETRTKQHNITSKQTYTKGSGKIRYTAT